MYTIKDRFVRQSLAVSSVIISALDHQGDVLAAIKNLGPNSVTPTFKDSDDDITYAGVTGGSTAIGPLERRTFRMTSVKSYLQLVAVGAGGLVVEVLQSVDQGRDIGSGVGR